MKFLHSRWTLSWRFANCQDVCGLRLPLSAAKTFKNAFSSLGFLVGCMNRLLECFHSLDLCTKTNLFVEYSVNGKTMKPESNFLCHSLKLIYLLGQMSFEPHTVTRGQKTLLKEQGKLSLAFFSRELMTWGPLVDNEQWERCFWFQSPFLQNISFIGDFVTFGPFHRVNRIVIFVVKGLLYNQ